MLKEGEKLVKRTGLLVKVVVLIISAGEIHVVGIVEHIPIYWKDLQTNLQYLSSPPLSINPRSGRNLEVAEFCQLYFCCRKYTWRNSALVDLCQILGWWRGAEMNKWHDQCTFHIVFLPHCLRRFWAQSVEMMLICFGFSLDSFKMIDSLELELVISQTQLAHLELVVGFVCV